MDLNVQDWKEFKIPKLFNEVEIAKSADIGNLEEGDTPFVGRTDANNGIQGYVKPVSITKGKCISISMVGTNVALYQENDFQASQNIAVLRNANMSYISALFICTLINSEMQLKYSYGRTVGKSNIEQMILKLPIQHNPDGTPVIDADKTYSDEGYIPDWQFMEDYIKSLHSEPITTTRGAAKLLSLGVDKWKEFNLSDVFIADTGNTDITQELLTDDGEIVVSAGEGNTGVIGRCSVEAKIFPQNTITLDMFGFAFPRPYKYKMVTHARIFSLSVKEHIMSRKQSIFMATMLNNSGYKYAYGRMCSWERVKNDTVSLPIQCDASGNPVIDPDKKYSDKGYIPDWDFMERYIDSLPYSDKIA